MSHRSVTGLLAVVAALPVVLVSVAGHTGQSLAAAPPAGPDDQVAATFKWQQSVQDYKQKLVLAAGATPNYSGARFELQDHALIISGTGKPAASVTAVMEQAPDQLTVKWEEVQLSRQQIQAAIDKAMTDHSVVSASALSDYSGIKVGVLTAEGSSALVARPDRLADVPVTYQAYSRSPFNTAQNTRSTGPQPIFGGARIIRPFGTGTAGCSTAWTVQIPNGTRQMMTAHHCNGSAVDGQENSGGIAGINWRLPAPDNMPVGESLPIREQSQQWDIQTIAGSTYSARKIFVGGISGVELSFAGGAGQLIHGELMAPDGAYSGAQLAAVEDADYTFRFCGDPNNGFCDPHNHFVLLHDYDRTGDAIAGEGDSGGTVQQGDRVAGVISAGYYGPPRFPGDPFGQFVATCKGISRPFGTCSSKVLISPWWRLKQGLPYEIVP